MQVLRALQLVHDTGRDALQLVKGIGFALAGGFGQRLDGQLVAGRGRIHQRPLERMRGQPLQGGLDLRLSLDGREVGDQQQPLDADTLMARLEALDDADALAFGNDNYRIEFEHRYAPGEKPFGNKYRFWLEDAVDDVAEYVVDWPTFERLANEYGLRLLYKARFDQVLADGYARSQLRSLLERMRVIDAEEVAQTGVVTPAMPPALWDVCTLYIGFAFEKV